MARGAEQRRGHLWRSNVGNLGGVTAAEHKSHDTPIRPIHSAALEHHRVQVGALNVLLEVIDLLANHEVFPAHLTHSTF